MQIDSMNPTRALLTGMRGSTAPEVGAPAGGPFACHLNETAASPNEIPEEPIDKNDIHDELEDTPDIDETCAPWLVQLIEQSPVQPPRLTLDEAAPPLEADIADQRI